MIIEYTSHRKGTCSQCGCEDNLFFNLECREICSDCIFENQLEYPELMDDVKMVFPREKKTGEG